MTAAYDVTRAYRLRVAMRAKRTISDIDRKFLDKYNRRPSVITRRRQGGKPMVALARILAAGCSRYGVTSAQVCRKNRSTQPVELARGVIVVALRLANSTLAAAGKLLGGRSPSAANRIFTGARRRPGIIEAARSLLIAARGAVAGDVVQVPIVVGSAAWCYLDRMAELDEITAATIRHRNIALMLDHAVGAE